VTRRLQDRGGATVLGALFVVAVGACDAGDQSSSLDTSAPAAAPTVESALALRRAGRVEESRRSYEELARAVPRDPLAWWGWAELLRHDLHDWRGAENAYVGALEADPTLVGARWDHATLLARLGRHDECLLLLESLLRDLPSDSPLRGPAELLATETRLKRVEARR
jgi:tetratricopeptide (TPR) repeat protein